MDNQDPRSAVEAVIALLRKATRIVQLAPFVYLLFFSTHLLVEPFIGEDIHLIPDTLMSVSPIMVIGMLVASRLLKLCTWHKVACLIPTTSQVEGYIDSFIFTFTQEEIVFINASLGILAVLFLATSIKHFTHGRKGSAI